MPASQLSIKQGKKSLGTADVTTGGTVHKVVTIQPGTGSVMLTLTSPEVGLSVGVPFAISSSSSSGAAASVKRVAAGPSGGTAPAREAVAESRAGGRVPTSNTPTPATGQVVARDDRFWIGTTPVLLRGVDAAPIQNADMKDSDYAMLEGWHMNFIRMRVFWHMLEPDPPHKTGGVWIHSWNEGAMTALEKQVRLAYDHGVYSLIENFCGPPCFSKGWPDWLYQAPYNSHGKDYTDAATANTDYWTDSLQQKFTKDFVTYLATNLKGVPGVMGYEPLNEPSQGTYPNDAFTTAMILDAQYPMARAVRAADPTRAVVFTTRGSSGEGILAADLSRFAALTNVAFDLHDYFGARWGDGLNMDPASATYGQSLQGLFDFTLTPGTPPYLGTVLGQLRFIRTFTNVLDPLGIPLLIGEFGGQGEAEPNIDPLYFTMAQAFNIEGVSWAAQSYNGSSSFFRDDGSLEPWVPILAEAAAQGG